MRLGVRGPLTGSTLRERAELLQRTGFEGIELGHEWLDTPAGDILVELDGTGISVSAIVGSINLLNPDPRERRRAIETDRARLQMAVELGASGVIEVPTFGSCKFPDISPVISPWALECDLLVDGLKQLVPDIDRTGVPILLEPLNRYETHFLNRQEQGVEICAAVGTPRCRLLSDLFHMHIEERSIPGALRQTGPRVGYVHVADSNRLQPGAGFMDYDAAFAALKAIDYDGWIVIESGADGDVESALRSAREILLSAWARA